MTSILPKVSFEVLSGGALSLEERAQAIKMNYRSCYGPGYGPNSDHIIPKIPLNELIVAINKASREILGVLLFEQKKGLVVLQHVVVLPENRGQGIGTSLMNNWVEAAKAQEISRFFIKIKLSLEVNDGEEIKDQLKATLSFIDKFKTRSDMEVSREEVEIVDRREHLNLRLSLKN